MEASFGSKSSRDIKWKFEAPKDERNVFQKFMQHPFLLPVGAAVLWAIVIEWYWKQGSMALLMGGFLSFLWVTRARKHDNIPRPVPWVPYLGNLLWYQQNWHRRIDAELGVMLKNGEDKPLFAISLPPGETFIVLADPEMADQIFRTDFADSVKSPFVKSCLYIMLGDGIFLSNGKVWKKHRNIASRIFTARSLRDYMFRVFDETADEMVDKIEELGNRFGEVDIYNMFTRLTLEAFTKVAFGVDLEVIKKAPQVVEFARAFDRSFQITAQRMVDPLWKVKRFLNIGVEKEIKGLMQIVDGFFAKVIQQNRQSAEDRTTTKKYDLINLFLQDNPKLTQKELRDIGVNFIIAGRDTTAQLLSWFFYELMQAPDVEAKILAEIDETVGLKDKAPIPFDMIKECKYLEGALLETLRLHPSVPAMERVARKDIVLRSRGEKYTLRKGDIVLFASYVMGRLPWVWENPLKFEPLRFVGKTYPACKYPAFNVQPRLCLGKHMALLEAKLAVIKILRRFKLTMVKGQNVIYVTQPTHPMKEGLRVIVEKREYA